jgi:hypothetical protein
VPYTPNILNQYTGINGQTLSYASNGTLTADPTAPLGAASYGWDMFNPARCSITVSFLAALVRGVHQHMGSRPWAETG